SLRPEGQEEFGTKVELKNLNSFAFVKSGLEYEEKRQAKILSEGGKMEQETRRYDEKTKKTTLMRIKDSADDYRLCLDPDIVPLQVDEAWKDKILAEIPELPDARKHRYVEEMELSAYDTGVITASKEMADFFHAAVNHGGDPKLVANWLMGDLSAYLNNNHQ